MEKATTTPLTLPIQWDVRSKCPENIQREQLVKSISDYILQLAARPTDFITGAAGKLTVEVRGVESIWLGSATEL